MEKLYVQENRKNMAELQREKKQKSNRSVLLKGYPFEKLKMSQTSIEENTTRVRLLKKKARNV
jgi:hypothetical protein